jgi:hypothetical protein
MKNTATISELSIIHGGLLDRFLILLGVAKANKDSAIRKIIFFVAITWIPLLILSAIQGYFYGNDVDIPFLEEFATHIRLGIALPLLIAAESVVDRRINLSLHQFTLSGLLTSVGLIKFEKAKATAERMSESYYAEIIILLLILGNLLFRINSNSLEVTTWIFPDSTDPSSLSYAGYWAASVSLPFFQFLLLRWFWRWFIWLRLLFLISKADLRLLPAHPDRSGGLGFLGESPLPFSVFTFVLSIVFAAILAERVLFVHLNLEDHYASIAGFAVLCVLINVIPLLAFVRPLSQARTKGIEDYHAMVSREQHLFQEKWITNNQMKDQEVLGHQDISTASDILPLYDAVKSMTVFPFNIKTMLITIVVSLLPLAAVFALQMPLADILRMIAGFLL